MKNNEMMINGKSYKIVRLEETDFDRHYKNPQTSLFQHEYALFAAISDLFAAVSCKSMCFESLKLYFRELPHAKNQTGEETDVPIKNKRTQEGLLEEMAMLVEKDIIGSITFPMMNICRAEVRAITEPDGSHTFLFTDGIYGFTAHLYMPGKGLPMRIEVKNMPGRKLLSYPLGA